ncbi:MAG: alpha/beta hydrolase [Paludibacteraceae bacterium]
MKNLKCYFFAATALIIPLTACSNTPPLSESPRHVSDGRLYEMRLFSPEMADTVTIDIWTPNDYDTRTRHHVVYMHDGQNLFDANATWNHQSWNMDSTTQRLIDQKTIPPTIIVGIHSNDATRIGDLMPQKLMNLVRNNTTRRTLDQLSGGPYRGETYLAFITHTLKPTIDRQFATDPTPTATSIMGSSMGGLISLAAMVEYPDLFGAAACLSTHINNPDEHGGLYDALKIYLTNNLQLDHTRRLYLDCGDQTVDADYTPYFDNMVALIDSLCTAEMQVRFFPGDEHSERCWEHRVDIPLTFIAQ